MSAELQNVFQCADQLLCLSLRNAVALAVIHQISQDPAWTVWESHPAANCWEGKGKPIWETYQAQTLDWVLH